MPENTNCRQLKFDALDQIAVEANSLLRTGYTAAGTWNLAQIAGHCANWMGYPMDGFPKAGFPINLMLWTMKKTIGKSSLKKILDSGSMKNKQPTMPQSVLTASAMSDDDAVALLIETIEKFKSFEGDFVPSPLFGDMDRETLTRLQLVHCGHHFRFLVPKNDA